MGVSASTAALVTLASAFGSQSWRPPELEVAPPPALTDFTRLQSLALQYLGRPYTMGGVGSPGFDCSGFVCRVYAEAGHALPRVSRDQAEVGERASLERLVPGDLLFFAEPDAPISHVGIYLGDGSMIHASSGRGEVVVAELGSSWFRDRLVGARRVLTSTAAMTYEEAPVRELVEHQGRFSLPATQRRPPRRLPPSYGPELTGAGVTSIGFRSGFLTEAGVLGAVLAPEATLRISSWALELTVALPIRLEIDEDITLGSFDRWQDYTRFLRHASVGLRNADFELRLSRHGEASLGTGLIVDRLAPGVQIRGVPGLSVARSALTLFGRWRTSVVEVETLLDDAVDPALAGLGVAVPLGAARVGVAAATDQRALSPLGARRAFTAGEVYASFDALSARSYGVELGLSVGALSALAQVGGGGMARAEGQWRPWSDVTLTVQGRIGVAGPRYLMNLFGPTYLAHREIHARALPTLDTRGVAEGRFHLTLKRVSVGGAYGQGFGAHRHPLDRRLEAYVALDALPLSRARRLDVRFTVLSRALFDDDYRVYTAHGGARITLSEWLFAELYVQKSETWEGGGGLTVTWAP